MLHILMHLPVLIGTQSKSRKLQQKKRWTISWNGLKPGLVLHGKMMAFTIVVMKNQRKVKNTHKRMSTKNFIVTNLEQNREKISYFLKIKNTHLDIIIPKLLLMRDFLLYM